MKVYFKKHPWNAEVWQTKRKVTDLQTIWNMSLDSENTVIDKNTQSAARQLLVKSFSSIKFISSSSIFFYFEDEADEAQFMLLATGIEI